MYKRSALSLAVASIVSIMSSAQAQESGERVNGGDTSPKLEEVVVTGSRIMRDGYSAPTPITVASTETLLNITPTNIPDGLNKLPQFQLSASPARSTHNFANTASHGNILNLRGVGGNRTLILMDGLRVPPTTYLGTVDVSVLPSLLVDRVEIVTGGASAVYGSDAVAGVVNYVLDKDYTGIKGVIQGGMSAEGDNEHSKFGLAGGFEFSDGAGHAIWSVEKFESDGMLRSDREDGVAGWIYAGSTPNCSSPTPGACSPGGASNPYMLVRDARLTVSHDKSLITSGAFAGNIILPNGDVTPFNRGTATGSPIFAVGGDGYTIPFDVSAVAPLDTEQAFGRVEYEINPRLSAHAQGIYSGSELSYSGLANSWTGVTPAPIFSGNPFLPDQVQAAMGPDEMINVGQNPWMGGPRPTTDEESEFWMAAFGLSGVIGDDFAWKLDYSHGESTHEVDQSDVYNWQRAYAAIDAVDDGNGNIVCRATLDSDPAIAERFSDCKPLNMLGVYPWEATPEGYAYASGTSSYSAKNTQDILSFSLAGSAFELPAGPVDFVVGAEYRMEELSLSSNADPALLDTPEERNAHFAGLRGVSPSALFYWLTNVGVAEGDSDVFEYFIEANVPILADVPGVEQLDLNLAFRQTDYERSGKVDTWKVGFQWSPISDLRFRGTVSTDIRAPSLFDLFAGDQSNIGTVFDPVTGQQENIPQVLGGNENLEPEESDTITYGFVFTPNAIEGLSLSVDYYELEIDKAIGSLNAQQIVENCFNFGGPECDLITRPSPDAFPSQVRIAPANISFLETSGIDIDISYTTDSFGPGNWSARLYANHLLKYESRVNEGAPVLDFVGIAEADSIPEGRPEWTAMFNLSYALDNLSVTLSEQYIGSMEVGLPGTSATFIDGDVDAVWYTDVTVAYDFQVADGSLKVFGTVNNLFDKDFPIVPGTIPGVNMPTTISVFDTIGRAFTVGTRFEF